MSNTQQDHESQNHRDSEIRGINNSSNRGQFIQAGKSLLSFTTLKLKAECNYFLSLENEEVVESVPANFSQRGLPWDRAVVQDNTDYKKIKENTTPNYVKIWSKVS